MHQFLKVVIDKDILGWADEHKEELLKEYNEVLQVSKHQDLPQRSFDEKIAEYCRQNGCDLMTGDAKSYTHFFEAGIKSVRITKRDFWKKADKPVYLVHIED
jgi:hypothetical protein